MPLQLNVAPYTKSVHYETIASWWKDYGWGRVPSTILPRGVVLYQNNEPVAAGFVHCSADAPFAFLAWPTVAPNVRASRMDILAFLVDEMAKVARAHVGSGGVVMGMTDNRPLMLAYRHVGFEPGEANVTSFFLSSGPGDYSFMREDDHGIPPQREQTPPELSGRAILARRRAGERAFNRAAEPLHAALDETSRAAVAELGKLLPGPDVV